MRTRRGSSRSIVAVWRSSDAENECRSPGKPERPWIAIASTAGERGSSSRSRKLTGDEVREKQGQAQEKWGEAKDTTDDLKDEVDDRI